MSLRIEEHAEPIPGYRLIERIGSGGFGEVWKAEAPGGLFKAIKFVQRDAAFDDLCAIGNNDPDRSRADQEWKSLVRVKSVRHPFILLLDRFENIDNYLVIVMELADRTLGDRFKECRSQGRPGIPRDELLGYLAEAAEVLDLMNSQYQLQHLDIKPQNLFLVHNHVKVADFGLVKDTTGGVKLMTITGGVTPVYAAPETFDGKFSRQSDQYSLAIVYQEMLTGARPFTGTSMKQLILQHLQNAHDLTPLPVHDRPIVAQALSKNTEDRFATCVDFIEQLRRATHKIDPGAEASPSQAPTPSEKPFHSVSKTVGARGQSGPVKPIDPNFSVEAAFLRNEVSAAPVSASAVPAPASEPIKTSRTPVMGMRRKARPQHPATHELPGIVQPALIVGIGQLGVETLSQLRARLVTEFGSPNAMPHLRFLAVDTDADTLQQATAGLSRSVLRTQETLLAKLQRPSHYLKSRDGKLATDSWLNPKLLHRIPREQNNAGLRALGRLAFVDNYRIFAKRLEAELHALCAQDTPHQSDSVFDIGLRSTRPRIYLVTSLTGNTGGGMFVDVAYLLRRLLNDQGHDAAEIVGLFYLPEARRDGASVVPLANSYAALTELQYYCQPEAVFSAHYETAASQVKGDRVSAVGPAFQRCILLPLPETKGKRTGIDNAPLAARAGDFLYRDLTTVLGQVIDEQRLAKVAALGTPAAPLLQSIGLSRILWPRHALLEECSQRLCGQLVTRWMSKDAKPVADTIRQWTAERWETLGMRSESLIERFQQLAEQSLNQKPETLLAEVLGLMQKLLGEAGSESGKPKAGVSMVPVVQATDCLERVLGIPEESRSANQAHMEPAMIERALEEIAHLIADECEQKLAELAVTLLEDPNFRLAGAEEALRQFCTTVEQGLKTQEPLARELADNAAQLYSRIRKLIDTSVQSQAPTSTQWTLIAKRPSAAAAGPTAADVVELVRTYAKARYHSLVLTHLNRLYLGLRGHLSDQIREVGFCRARLGELHVLLQPAALPGKKDKVNAGERALFPPGCLDLREAIAQVSHAVSPEDLVCFDQRIQAWIKGHCQALLEICMGSSSMVRNLAPVLLQEAEMFLAERLQGASVAEMYLTRKRTEFGDTADDMIFDDLQRCLDEATPEFGKLSDGNEISIVSVPSDEHGAQIRDLLSKRLNGAKIMQSERQDEIVFYHELINVKWTDLEQLGGIALEAYHQRCNADPSSLHSREDVFEWQIISESKR